MSKQHCMIDLETLGVRPGSIILSIGAVMFDPETGGLGKTFYRNVTKESCETAGLTFDQSTVDWWAQQSDEAKGFLNTDPADITKALSDFTEFWQKQEAKYFWSHGANFDEVLLSCAYRATKGVVPWKYSNVMCSRTVLNMTNLRPDRSVGTHHNALDDAISQARAVSLAYEGIKYVPRT